MRNPFIDMIVIEWVLEQIRQGGVIENHDWTEIIYKGQKICKHEYEYGLPPPERIKVAYVQNLRSLLESLGLVW